MDVRSQSVLFTPEGKDSLEILDACDSTSTDCCTRIGKAFATSVSLKLGRVHIPYDDLATCFNRIRHCRRAYAGLGSSSWEGDISVTDVKNELDVPNSRERTIVQAVSDWKEFVSSILRGIQECN
jgi:hypothetical protein